MRLDLAFVDLYHRPQRLRLASCFGWLHHPSVLRGLTPPACTNLHCSNSIQMCERNPTLSAGARHAEQASVNPSAGEREMARLTVTGFAEHVLAGNLRPA